MIKLLATDLDGTLFYPKKRFALLSKKNAVFLKKFISNGNKVVLVSGRNVNIAKKISKKVESNVDMIGCNGSVILKDGDIFKDSPIPHEYVKNLYEDNIDPNVISWAIMSDKYPLAIAPCKLGFTLKSLYRIGLKCQFAYKDDYIFGDDKFYQVINDSEARIYKVMAIYGLGKKNKIKARLGTRKFTDAYGTKFECLWSNQAIEFTNKGVNKAYSLKKLIDVLKLNLDEVAVVGDSGNDISLFEAFENSFVMSHAPKAVKKKAKTEIKSVYCIEKYIDEEGEKNESNN